MTQRYVLQYHGQKIGEMRIWLQQYNPYYQTGHLHRLLAVVNEIPPEDLLVGSIKFGTILIFPLLSTMFRYYLQVEDYKEVTIEFEEWLAPHRPFYFSNLIFPGYHDENRDKYLASTVIVLTEDDANRIIQRFNPISVSRQPLGIQRDYV